MSVNVYVCPATTVDGPVITPEIVAFEVWQELHPCVDVFIVLPEIPVGYAYITLEMKKTANNNGKNLNKFCLKIIVIVLIRKNFGKNKIFRIKNQETLV